MKIFNIFFCLRNSIKNIKYTPAPRVMDGVEGLGLAPNFSYKSDLGDYGIVDDHLLYSLLLSTSGILGIGN